MQAKTSFVNSLSLSLSLINHRRPVSRNCVYIIHDATTSMQAKTSFVNILSLSLLSLSLSLSLSLINHLRPVSRNCVYFSVPMGIWFVCAQPLQHIII